MSREPVGFWLGRMAPVSAKVYRSVFNRFLVYVNHQSGWVGVDAQGLLDRQRGNGDYAVLDLLQDWVSGAEKARKSKELDYVAVQSFFMHNRCALPKDPAFKIRGSKPTVAPKLSVNHIVDVAKAANLRDRSIVLVKWQAMLDNERLEYVCQNLAGPIVEQMKREVHPVRLDLPSRKENERPWYTFIGRDAVDALKEYFEKERGWPKPNEAVWLSTHGDPLTTSGIEQLWMRLTRRIGFVPKKRGSVGVRYGFNAHEARDVAKSLLHTHAKGEGFDMDCSEFWLGHTVDPLGYDKFMLDQEYVRKQYLIAEPYLNIVSSPIDARRQEDQERIRQLESKLAKVDEIEKALLEMKQLVQESIR